LLRDAVALLLPLVEKEVRCALQNLRVNTLLHGWRGQPQGDIDALVETVLHLANFVELHADRLAGCDLNPVVVRPQGKGVVVVDALVRLR
jgi:hypothetical protein